jgi:hypothetical protein
MFSRRTFLERLCLTGGMAALLADADFAARQRALASGTRPHVKVVRFRDDTILRLGGSGDNYVMTWAADDRQLVGVCDGAGWTMKTFYNSRLYGIVGGPQNAKFEEISTYPDKLFYDVGYRGVPDYYGFGILAVDNVIYQFLSLISKGSSHFDGAKLIYSADNGQTWHNQDGSSPVVFECYEQQSRDTMTFFREPQSSFPILNFLQMGRNYTLNRDGYAYAYAPNGVDEGTMNELVMFRVPKNKILDRGSYEFYSGTQANGAPTWASRIEERKPIHRFPIGWMGPNNHYSWCPSVVYNAPLGLYMMASWGWDFGEDTQDSTRASYLGLWVSAHPWGPWDQIHENARWTPGGDRKAHAYSPVIAPKWIAPNGKSFWLVWTDYQHTAEFDLVQKAAFATKDEAEFNRRHVDSGRFRPYYAFNAQRVDFEL